MKEKGFTGSHRMSTLMRWLILLFITLTGCATTHEGKIIETAAPQAIDTTIEEKWGVRVLSIRQSAEGYMLDFRYRVIDAEKAAPLFDRKIKPHLIDEA